MSTKELNDDIQYFTSFTNKYIQQSQKLLEDCVGFASQINSVHIGTISSNKFAPPSEIPHKMIYNERDVEKLDAKEKNAQKIWVKCLKYAGRGYDRTNLLFQVPAPDFLLGKHPLR